MKISKKIFALIFVLTILVASLSSMSFATDVEAYVDTVTTTTTVAMEDTIAGLVESQFDLPDLSGSTDDFIEMIKGILEQIRNFFSSVSDTLLEAFGGSSSSLTSMFE